VGSPGILQAAIKPFECEIDLRLQDSLGLVSLEMALHISHSGLALAIVGILGTVKLIHSQSDYSSHAYFPCICACTAVKGTLCIRFLIASEMLTSWIYVYFHHEKIVLHLFSIC